MIFGGGEKLDIKDLFETMSKGGYFSPLISEEVDNEEERQKRLAESTYIRQVLSFVYMIAYKDELPQELTENVEKIKEIIKFDRKPITNKKDILFSEYLYRKACKEEVLLRTKQQQRFRPG